MALDIQSEGLLDPAKIENGVEMDVLNDFGEPIYLNEDPNYPLKVLVRSVRCKGIDDLNLRLQKKTSALNRGRRVQDQTISTDEFTGRQAAVCTVALLNFSKDNPNQSAGEEEVYRLYCDVRFEPIRDQVWAFASNDANYKWGAASGNSNGIIEGQATALEGESQPALAAPPPSET